MKNKHIEATRKLAKASLKKSNINWSVDSGIRIYHRYDDPRERAYWDDFDFVIGSQKVIVCWVHPRMALCDAVEMAADKKATGEVGMPLLHDIIDKTRVTYKKVGKSRKKPLYYGMASAGASFEAWYERKKEWQNALFQADLISVGLKLTVNQWSNGRGVHIVYPAELRTKEEVISFALRVKAHLLGEINLFEGMDDYRYTTADYRREHQKEFK